MSRVAKMLADYVLCKGVIIKDEYDLYEYGFQIALETGLSLIISGIIASMLHMIPEGILFFIVFIPLRSYAGGLHLKHYFIMPDIFCSYADSQVCKVASFYFVRCFSDNGDSHLSYVSS